jgi:glucosylceramidase
VLPGAFRVATAMQGSEVIAASFLNPDGSRVAIVHRKSGTGPVTFAIDGTRYAVTLPDGAIATLRWSGQRASR